MPPGRVSPTHSLTERQRNSIATAIRSGMSVNALHLSGRFKGVPKATLARIADDIGVERKRLTVFASKELKRREDSR